jgi:hypothetical protein
LWEQAGYNGREGEMKNTRDREEAAKRKNQGKRQGAGMRVRVRGKNERVYQAGYIRDERNWQGVGGARVGAWKRMKGIVRREKGSEEGERGLRVRGT